MKGLNNHSYRKVIFLKVKALKALHLYLINDLRRETAEILLSIISDILSLENKSLFVFYIMNLEEKGSENKSLFVFDIIKPGERWIKNHMPFVFDILILEEKDFKNQSPCVFDSLIPKEKGIHNY